MTRTPYAPPKSKVDDVATAPPRYLLRTKWFYLAMSALLAGVTIWGLDELPFTLVAVMLGVVLGALVTFVPVRMLLSRRSGSSPWWWDALFWTVVLTMLFGAEYSELLMVLGFVSLLFFAGVVTVAAFAMEARYKLRVYSTARGVAFVGEDAL